jgi:hypothetical protein
MIIKNYNSNERRIAKRMIKDGAEVREEDTGDGIIKSYIQGAIVIVNTARKGSFHCVECSTDMCAHCIIARMCREGLSGEDLKRVRAPVSEIWKRIGSLYEDVIDRLRNDFEYSRGYRGEWHDHHDDEYEMAAEIAAEICADILESEDRICEAIKLISMLADEMDNMACHDAIYGALEECRKDLRERLSEMSAEEFADAVIEQECYWLLDHVPNLSRDDMEDLMERFKEHGVEASMLKGLYFGMGLYEEFVTDSGEYADPRDIMDAAIAMDARSKRDAAKKAVSKIGMMTSVIIDNKVFIESLGMENILKESIERSLRSFFDAELLSDMIRLSGSSEKDAVRKFTQFNGYVNQVMLCVFTDRGYSDEVEEYARSSGYRSHGKSSWTSLAESMAKAEKYECAIMIRRNSIRDILDAGNSQFYESAVNSLRVLEEMHSSGVGASVKLGHEEFLADIREKHKRKYKFRELLDNLYR